MKVRQLQRLIQGLVVAAAAAASVPALAQNTVTGGTATLTFSDNAVSTLSLISVTVGASGSTSVVTPGKVFSFPITDGTFSGDALSTVITDPSAGVTLTRNSTVITLNDFKVDRDTRTLLGDITIGGTITQDIALYTFTSVTEDMTDPANRKVNATGMFITELALNTLGDALGVPTFLRPAVAQVDFGTLVGDVQVAAIPEPSTYLLMGLGLAGVGLLKRRRDAQARADEGAVLPQAA